MAKKLTIKQERFVQEYIKDGNGRKAAITAGYSKNCAAEIASENLMKPNIAQYVERYQSRAAAKLDIDQEYVLSKLKDWVEVCDKQASMKALELIGKHLQMFTDKMEVSVKSHEEELKRMADLYEED